ncbi:hypothetical protein ACGFYZ_33610 [Streptomyces sp. NPDC048330]|uniref:hypothetical protein n=1 Tax=Streptomyces sp. NPDC048330 TaxID=3365533 RepID=UPI00371891F1
MSAPITNRLHLAAATELLAQTVPEAGPGTGAIPDMADLGEAIRVLLDVTAFRDTRVSLGGRFDVVISGRSHGAVTAMDELQGGCGPVIDDVEAGWLYWLVPPRTTSRWDAHAHAVCLGAPHTLMLPSLDRTRPPGPYWLRPWGADRLVPSGPLREVLAEHRPEPAPHALLAARLGISRRA